MKAILEEWINNTTNHTDNQGQQKDDTDIAIIGIACRYPGANDYQQFWENLSQGVNSIREVTPDHWDVNQYYSSHREDPNKSISKWAGLLDHIDTFDAPFFNLSPRETKLMDPQQRILLEETWHCIEDSGVSLHALQAANTSIYIGYMATDYYQCIMMSKDEIDGYSCLGSYGGVLANRLSYFLNLSGESQSIDTACAASLVALHNARKVLLAGESKFAIVAGVNIICHPWKIISFSKANMLSPDGQCKTFDAAANGYVPGEGVGVLLLEKLKDAEKNKHHIYGILKSSVVHHNGKTKSITAPGLTTQQHVITEALEKAHISSEDISYIEAHGTGTSLGDPIEIEALTRAFNTPKKQYCYIGSVKTNIGHLEGAAGIAGVIKVLLMMKHKKIVKTLNVHKINPIISLEHSPFQIAQDLHDWQLPENVSKRYAGVSSFGFSGVSSHVILEEYIPSSKLEKNENKNIGLPFLLSAKSIYSLKKLIEQWQKYIKSSEYAAQDITDITQTLMHGRENFNYCYGFIIQTKAELSEKLQITIDPTAHFTFNSKDKYLILKLHANFVIDYKEFHAACSIYPILSILGKKCLKSLNTLSNEKIQLQDLETSSNEKMINIRTFIVNYIVGEALHQSGVKIGCVTGYGLGGLAGAVICKMLTFEEALQWLLGTLPVIQMTRPQFPFFMANKIVAPYHITSAYCQLLRENLILDQELQEKLISQARELIVNQFTYKKFLHEWDKILTSYNIDIQQALDHPESLPSEQMKLFLLILILSLKKLNQKWELTDNILIANDSANELIDLLIDEAITPLQFSTLLLESNKQDEALASSLQNYSYRLDSNKPYKLLKIISSHLLDTNDVESWLDNILLESTGKTDTKSNLSFDHDHFLLDISENTLLSLNDFKQSFPPLLLLLWKNGIPIQWEKWYSRAYSTISMPNYPFKKEHYWLTIPSEKIEEDSLKNMDNKSDIAIIGISGIFPGSPNVETFWQNLIEQKDLISEIPPIRWRWQDYYGDGENQTKAKWGGFVEGIDQFDANFFNISPREAELMDPQQRLMLEVVWNAMEDSGYTQQNFSKMKTGLFLGVTTNDYAGLIDQAHITSSHVPTGVWHCILANRISYLLNLNGPSQPIDTACSSSLVAIHNAILAIHENDCDVAIAGGVNALLSPSTFIEFSKAGMLSDDGRCKTFDKKANGYVRGEGAGAIILKSLHKALADHDSIYGIIKGTAVNHGGHVNSLTVPNPNSQSDVIVLAYQRAKIDINTVNYIETHGTGTSLGDPIEVNGLKKAFAFLQKQENSFVKNNYCGLGSVKTNIGHLEAAAGIASVIKILLAMREKKLPGLVHFNELNPYISLDNSPFSILSKTISWHRVQDESGKELPYRAGISSFGFGGTNAHIIIEEPPVTESVVSGIKPFYLITLSAKKIESLYQKQKDLKTWLITHAEKFSIEDISFTLNKGRKHFKIRCAWVVSTINDLIQSLDEIHSENASRFSYISSENIDPKKMNIEPGKNEILLNSLLQDNITNDTYRNILIEIEKHFINGDDINWDMLHLNESQTRISLPTYPFLKKRYWIPEKNEALKEPNLQENTMSNLLIDKIQKLNDTIQFIKILKGNEFYLTDHLVRKIPVLPGAAYIEMVRAGAATVFPEKKITEIRNIVWSLPIMMDDVERSEQIIFTDIISEKDSLMFKVFTQKANSKPNIHAYGKIVFSSLEPKVSESLDIDDIRKRCLNKKTKQDIYDVFNEIGLNYGPAFQVIKDTCNNSSEILGHIQLPDHLKTTLPQYVLHPSLLDGALQTCFGLLDNTRKLYLPFSIEKIILHNALTSSCYAYAERVSDQTNNDLIKFNIKITDDKGKLLVIIDNFMIRAFSNEAKATPVKNKNVYYYSSAWKEASLKPTNTASKTLLIFDELGHITQSFRELYGVGNVIRVKNANVFQIINHHEFQINFKNADDYLHLIQHVFKNHPTIDSILFCTYLRRQTDIINQTEINEQLNTIFYPIFYLSQSIIQEKIQHKIQIIIVNQHSSLVTESMSGFAKTLHLEKTNLICRVIHTQNIHAIHQEINANEEEVQYLENGQRLIKCYQEITEHKSDMPLTIKKHGVYLITGGVGGLGLIFATFLAETYQAKLVLTGRSVLKDEQKKLIDHMQEAGSEVMYSQTDVTNFDEMNTLISQIRQRFGGLNGIIHAAGVLRDAFIVNKTAASMAYVLDPKINGTINLDLSTQLDTLDFFIVFSSMVSIIGNAGQCDYAFANRFMDAYMSLREKLMKQGKRSGRSIAINWPLWAEGGMQINKVAEQLMERLLGVIPLETSDGLQAFIYALTHKETQTIVLLGDKIKIEKHLGLVVKAPLTIQFESNPVAETTVNEGINMDKSTLFEKVLLQFIKMITDILKIPLEDFNPDENFSEYGMDSMTNTELTISLNEYYDLDLTPAILFEHSNLRSVVNYLLEHYLEAVQKKHLTETTSHKTDPNIPPENISPEILPSTPTQLPTASVLPDHIAPSPSLSEIHSEDIAIIGMSGIFPGAANLEQFWENLEQQKDSVTEIPPSRWNWQDYFGTGENKTRSKWGGFIKDIDKFDPGFFNISPYEAELMDPQHRLFLQTVWQTIENSSYTPKQLATQKTGVFVGVSTNDYNEIIQQASQSSPYIPTGNLHCVLPNRVSYLLSLTGPSVAVDAACSSSLVAIHQAVKAINNGDCDMAIAGGVNAILTPTLNIAFDQAGMLSEDGRCKTFDKSANGYVRGEGVGAILLKPLKKALEDNDFIYGVIKGSAVNHGGHVNSLTVPNPNAQAEAIVMACERAHVNIDTITYVEAHGTGTSLGDPIEVNGLKKAFQILQNKQDIKTTTNYCGISSVKTNIGHLEAAAGIAGIIKVLLSLQKKKIPGLAHFKELNPYIDLKQSPFYIVDATKEWKNITNSEGKEILRRAGISSFGFGGVNAHIIIEERPKIISIETIPKSTYLLTFSAKTPIALKQYINNFSIWLEHADKDISLRDISYSLNIGRTLFDYRYAMVVSSIDQLKETCKKVMADEIMPNVFKRNEIKEKPHDQAIFKKLCKQIMMELSDVHKKSDEDYNDNLIALANFYVDGYDLDLSALYHQQTPKKVPLPGYCFAQEESYWVTKNNAKIMPQVIPQSNITQSNMTQSNINSTETVLEKPLMSEPSSSSTSKTPSANNLSTAILNQLKSMLATLLKINIDTLNDNKEFKDYGMDSIGTTEFTMELNNYYKLDLNPAVILENNTLLSLTKFLISDYIDLMKAHHKIDVIINLETANTEKLNVEADLTTKIEDIKEKELPVKPTVSPHFRYSNFKEYPGYIALKQRQIDLGYGGKDSIFFDHNEGIARDTCKINGKKVINFGCYNYLGFSGHPAVSKAAIAAIKKYGTSVSASRVVAGEKKIHRDLEIAIAKLIGAEDSIVYSAGHATNVSTIAHLFGPKDLILHDELAHNSLIQGALFSGAARLSFSHNDWRAAEKMLELHRHSYERILIIIEGVYSMDGDIPDVPRFIDLKERFDAMLMIDEAHSIGVIGKHGGGVREYFDIDPSRVDIWMGTLSKAFGSCGGYIAGSKELVEYLKYTSPGFVFSAGISPPNTASALEAIKLLSKQTRLIAHLHHISDVVRETAIFYGFDIGDSKDTPIVPIILGNSRECILISKQLLKKGVNIKPIIYPAVAENAARLRLFITAQHTEKQVDFTFKMLNQIFKTVKRKLEL